MSSSSSAALVPRVGSLEAVLAVQSPEEIPLIDIGKRIIGMLDRISYTILLDAIAQEPETLTGLMPSRRANSFNVLISDNSEVDFRVGYLHFVNEDGSVGQRISIFGDQIKQAASMAYDSFVPLVKAIRVAAGTALEDDTHLATEALFGRKNEKVKQLTLIASKPELLVGQLAILFNRVSSITDLEDDKIPKPTYDQARLKVKDGYYSYPHDLQYFR